MLPKAVFISAGLRTQRGGRMLARQNGCVHVWMKGSGLSNSRWKELGDVVVLMKIDSRTETTYSLSDVL